MKKTTKKPLALSTQTIRTLDKVETLSADQLQNVVGGTVMAPSSYGISVRTCM